jgi:hypothetical protein
MLPKKINFSFQFSSFQNCKFSLTHQKILKPVQDSFPTKPVPELQGEKHFGIFCNHCKEDGFQGKRFKCLNCLDYDLCELCYGNRFQFHEINHAFKIMKPGEHFLAPKIDRFPNQFVCGTKLNFSK